MNDNILLEVDGAEAEQWLEGVRADPTMPPELTKIQEAELRLGKREHPCNLEGQNEAAGLVRLCRAGTVCFAHCHRCGLVNWEATRVRS